MFLYQWECGAKVHFNPFYETSLPLRISFRNRGSRSAVRKHSRLPTCRLGADWNTSADQRQVSEPFKSPIKHLSKKHGNMYLCGKKCFYFFIWIPRSLPESRPLIHTIITECIHACAFYQERLIDG